MKGEFFAILRWEPFASVEEIKAEIASLEEHPFIAVHHYYLALPFTFLDQLAKETSSPLLTFGATSMPSIEKGAFTQSVAVSLLKEANAKFILVGAFENQVEEPRASLVHKINSAAENEIIPLFCVGETLKEFEENHSKEVLTTQLKEGLQECSEKGWEKLQVIYEAPWILEAPFLPDPAKLNEAYLTCRTLFKELFGEDKAAKIKIHCAIPNDLLDLFSYIENLNADGFYFSKGNLSLNLLKQGVPVALAKPGVEADSKIVGDAVLAASTETESINLTSSLKEKKENGNQKKDE